MDWNIRDGEISRNLKRKGFSDVLGFSNRWQSSKNSMGMSGSQVTGLKSSSWSKFSPSSSCTGFPSAFKKNSTTESSKSSSSSSHKMTPDEVEEHRAQN